MVRWCWLRYRADQSGGEASVRSFGNQRGGAIWRPGDSVERRNAGSGWGQVGTGVSAEFGNDDPGNVPSTVEFAITELPATITASTVFKRDATTTYSTADNGYTWSDRVSVPGTADSGGVQQVTGAAIATLLGV